MGKFQQRATTKSSTLVVSRDKRSAPRKRKRHKCVKASRTRMLSDKIRWEKLVAMQQKWTLQKDCQQKKLATLRNLSTIMPQPMVTSKKWTLQKDCQQMNLVTLRNLSTLTPQPMVTSKKWALQKDCQQKNLATLRNLSTLMPQQMFTSKTHSMTVPLTRRLRRRMQKGRQRSTWWRRGTQTLKIRVRLTCQMQRMAKLSVDELADDLCVAPPR